MAEYAFDIPSKLVTVLAPDTDVTVQEVYDVCRDFEDLPQMMPHLPIVDAEGKTNMGGAKESVIFLFMVNGWKIKFEDRPGPSTVVCTIGDGNTFGRVGDKNSTEDYPLEPSAYVFGIVYQATTGATIETDVSGLTPTESQQLSDIDTNVDTLLTITNALKIANDLTNEQANAEHTTSRSTGKIILRNTDTLTRWEADAFEDEAQTIPYGTNPNAGIESAGMLVEVAWS